MTNSNNYAILLDDEREADFLSPKTEAQSRAEKLKPFFSHPRNVPLLLEDIMGYGRGKHPNSRNGFQEGHQAWNKGTKDIMKSNKTSFKKGEFLGNKHPNWKGGKTICMGYIYIKKTHPFCNTLGYVYEHRLIMEKHLNRFLKPEERVHHLNGVKTDNRIANLKLFSNESEHQKFHHNLKDGYMKAKGYEDETPP